MEPVLATRLPRAWSATPSGGMKGRGREDSYVTWQPITKDGGKKEQRFKMEELADPEQGGR